MQTNLWTNNFWFGAFECIFLMPNYRRIVLFFKDDLFFLGNIVFNHGLDVDFFCKPVARLAALDEFVDSVFPFNVLKRDNYTEMKSFPRTSFKAFFCFNAYSPSIEHLSFIRCYLFSIMNIRLIIVCL